MPRSRSIFPATAFLVFQMFTLLGIRSVLVADAFTSLKYEHEGCRIRSLWLISDAFRVRVLVRHLGYPSKPTEAEYRSVANKWGSGGEWVTSDSGHYLARTRNIWHLLGFTRSHYFRPLPLPAQDSPVNYSEDEYTFSYLLPALLSAAPPAAFAFKSLRRRHRHRRNLCPTCAYDLRASQNLCPECGTPIPLQ